jgi:F-type H+-transporting ATPase subunit delta
LRQSIRGYADGVIEREPQSSLATTASELRAVRAVIDGSQDLRLTLLDPGVAMASRRSVVRDLLDNRVGAPTIRLVVHSIEVDRAPELLDNLSWLAARIEAAARSLQPASEVTLGRQGAEERVDGYASATLEGLSGESELATVEAELSRFHQILAGSEELSGALADRELPSEVRRKIVADLLSGRVSQVTAELAGYATQVGRPRDYETLLVSLVDRVAAERDRRLADVRSAVELDDAQRADLASALRRVVGRDVDVRVTVDPDLLAGFVATVGDTVVDASARHRLEVLKERLVLPEVTPIGGEAT